MSSNTTLPDKWVRKAIHALINNMTVGTQEIPCFDTNTANYNGDAYVILSTQTNLEESKKCKDGWRHTILIEAVTRKKRNDGSRVLSEDIIQSILEKTTDLELDTNSGLSIRNINVSTPNDISVKNDDNVIHRKFLRFEMLIN